MNILEQQSLPIWTPDQLREKAFELADMLRELRVIEENKKNAAKDFDETIKELKVRINFTAQLIREQSEAQRSK